MSKSSSDFWEALLNGRYFSFPHSFYRENDQFTLVISNHEVCFPIIPGEPDFSPYLWLNKKHKDSSIHEPRLVGWLLALAEKFQDRPVKFYDVGALYGYFSLVALELFNDVKVKAIEGNPKHASYLRNVIGSCGSGKLELENCVVGEANRNGKFLVEGFRIKPCDETQTLMTPDRTENTAKTDFGEPDANLTTLGSGVLSVRSRPLLELMDVESDGTIEILKIDTEGYQAQFLPPASPELIKRQAIILLELDALEKISWYGSTNKDLLQIFCEAGYALYWCQHRDANSKVQKVEQLDSLEEVNSLLVLMPPAHQSVANQLTAN